MTAFIEKLTKPIAGAGKKPRVDLSDILKNNHEIMERTERLVGKMLESNERVFHAIIELVRVTKESVMLNEVRRATREAEIAPTPFDDKY